MTSYGKKSINHLSERIVKNERSLLSLNLYQYTGVVCPVPPYSTEHNLEYGLASCHVQCHLI